MLTNEQIERLLYFGGEPQELRQYFGDHRYNELRVLAAELKAREDADDLMTEALRKRVYIVPGIMGSKLWGRRPLLDDLIWLDLPGIALGHVQKLKYGHEPRPVYASGIFLTAYLKMKLSLSVSGYDVKELPYDWRHSLPDLGKALLSQIATHDRNPVTLVCHSMGGLVARRMAELDPDRKIIDRVITLGTPNFGSYSPVEICNLSHETLQLIGKLDLVHTPKEIADTVVRHFPGLIEMLPSPDRRPQEPYFTTGGWPAGGVRPLKTVLTNANAARKALAPPDDRFIQIVGMGQPTIQKAKLENGQFVFERSLDGDGTVPRDLAEMGDVDRYYVVGQHGDLLNLDDSIEAVRDIVESGRTDALRTETVELGLVSESVLTPEILSTEALRAEARDGVPKVGVPTENDLLGRFVAGAHTPPPAVDAMDGHLPELAPWEAAPEPPPIADTRIAGARITDRQPEETGEKLAGYPVEMLKTASDIWEVNEQRRKAGEKHADSGEFLKAEPELRQKLYTRRLMAEAHRVIEELAPPVSPIVAESLTAAESSDQEILNFITEKRIGELEEFISVLFLKRAPLASRSVGRIIRKSDGYGFGTGFMVAPGVLVTNFHVLPDIDVARRTQVQFDYEISVRSRTMESREFELLPDLFYIRDKSLDFAFVAVSGTSRQHPADLADYSYLPLIDALGKIRAESPVNIIQHPEGQQKQVVFRKSRLTPLPETQPGETAATGVPRDNVLQYSGDTKPGSSGSPVFNDRWEVVGLHHASVPVLNADGEFKVKVGGTFRYLSVDEIKAQGRVDDVVWVANEGIRVSKLIAMLKRIRSTDPKTEHKSHIDRILQAGANAGINGAYSHHRDVVIAEARSEVPAIGHETTGPIRPEPAVQPPVSSVPRQTLTATIPIEISVRIGDGAAASVLSLSSAETAPGGEEVAALLAERRYKVEDLADRAGFDRDFLGERVELPGLLNTSPYTLAPRKDNSGRELTYDHYSVLMCRERRLAFLSAGNFDPAVPIHPARDKQPWSIDPRLDEHHQADNRFYKFNDLDRGHLFRRTDGSWGDTLNEALRADHDTYFWTNIAPQHEIYNQSKKEKDWLLWGQLENHVTTQAGNSRLSIINGPVFSVDDPVHRGLSIPKAFWKVVISCKDDKLRVHAFKIGQESLIDDLARERFEPGPFGVYQVKLRDLERQTHLDFGALKSRDVLESFAVTERFTGPHAIVRLIDIADMVM